MQLKTFTVPEEIEKLPRADKFIADMLPAYSRSALAKLFELEKVYDEYGRLYKVGDKLRRGQVIIVNIEQLEQKPDHIELPIIYEDDNVVVIDKPAGVISHARGKYWQEASVASFVRQRAAELNGERAGIVHRLDRATSGIMVCSKNDETTSFLQKQFSDRTVEKTYCAVVNGKLNPEEAIINMPIERNPSIPKEFMVGPNGREAQTYYRTLKTNEKYSLLELKPKTGRTHQLRVHLKHQHHPIVGDTLYGGEVASRLLLHASSIKLLLPNKKETTFKSELPQIFKDYV